MQSICGGLTEGFHIPVIYMHYTISNSGCSGMQGIYTQLTGGSMCLIYMHCTISSSECSGIQGIHT